MISLRKNLTGIITNKNININIIHESFDAFLVLHGGIKYTICLYAH